MASVTEFVASWQSARCCQTKEIRARDPECLDDSLQNCLQILMLGKFHLFFLSQLYFADLENKP